jgi:hypothetical protein
MHGVGKGLESRIYYENLLPVVQGGTLLVGLLLLALASVQPERMRLESLRLGFQNFGAIFSRSAVSLAVILAGLASALMATQFMFSLADSWRIILAVSVNLTELFLVFALLLEYCRLSFHRRALGFVALWLFGLGVVPFILAGVFSNEAFAQFSLLAPGFFALTERHDPDWSLLFLTLLVHLGFVVLLWLGWQRQWKQLLVKAA